MSTQPVVGVDIGGSGIKAALVDVARGTLASERIRVETPDPAVPDAVVAAVAALVGRLAEAGPVGVGLPSAVLDGAAMTAANIDPSWIGVRAAERMSEAIGRAAIVLNDADAAGLAEIRHGAGKGVSGVVLVLTLGTGIGSALFLDGQLVPNTELGHIEVRGKDGERRASAGARERKGLSYKKWSKALNEYLGRVDELIWPDLVILGGGVSKRAERFLPRLDARPPVVAAALQNEAGIVGAAMRAAELQAPVRRRRAATPGRPPAGGRSARRR